jgi:hypothetical protein
VSQTHAQDGFLVSPKGDVSKLSRFLTPMGNTKIFKVQPTAPVGKTIAQPKSKATAGPKGKAKAKGKAKGKAPRRSRPSAPMGAYGLAAHGGFGL